LFDVHPADIADLLDELPPQSAVVIFDLLSIEIASEVLDETGSLVRRQIIEKVDKYTTFKGEDMKKLLLLLLAAMLAIFAIGCGDDDDSADDAGTDSDGNSWDHQQQT